jgi:hypothetical protein
MLASPAKRATSRCGVTGDRGLVIGAKVRVERALLAFPANGEWVQFSGQLGTIVAINPGGEYPERSEFAVQFGRVRRKPTTFGSDGRRVTWFRAHELTVLPSGTPGQAQG